MKATRTSFALVLAAGVALTGVSAQAGIFKQASEPAAVPGEFIVGLASGKSVQEAKSALRAQLAQSFGENEIVSIDSLAMDSRIQKVRVRHASKSKSVLSELKRNPAVRYAEPNYIYRTLTNDTHFSRQWDMVNTGQRDKPEAEATPTNPGQTGTPGSDINVQGLWNRGITGSKDIVVAVIDTGLDVTHPDLRDNVWTNPNEIAGNGVDDDHNGVVDDVHGANFVATAATGNPADDVDHGTHCAGTIGARGDNHEGIAGINWDVTIMPVKFLGEQGGTAEGAINAIKYATKMGAKIMSNSWGGGGYSQALFDAINDASKQGILFVAAAGNGGFDGIGDDNDSVPNYPSNYETPNMLAVAAIDNRDGLTKFSNFGKKLVHVAAPGMNILSSVPVASGSYKIFSGTSMAWPHVSGVAALVWSHEPNLSMAQLKERLIKTSVPLRTLRSKVVAKGRIDATNAIDNVVPPSNEPAEDLWVNRGFALESPHPYVANFNQTYEISVPGVKYIRVIFEKLATESGYDTVSIESTSGEVMDSVSGSKDGYVSEYVQGDKLVLRLKSDSSEQAFGFKISQVQVIR